MRRDGEDSRQFLIRCTERYLASHPADGFTNDATADVEVARVREAAAVASVSDAKIVEWQPKANDHSRVNGFTVGLNGTIAGVSAGVRHRISHAKNLVTHILVLSVCHCWVSFSIVERHPGMYHCLMPFCCKFPSKSRLFRSSLYNSCRHL
jgi:hypothetical protein